VNRVGLAYAVDAALMAALHPGDYDVHAVFVECDDDGVTVKLYDVGVERMCKLIALGRVAELAQGEPGVEAATS
jgi:hypothetical protein